mmetsp:Transcript_1459/g.4631  ORF Transcript_1459/g.4631 Transcript_1459/m.4631 type:complete len:85 (+) Transcript_1459:991-1245(+)
MSKLEAVFPAPKLRREITRNNQWQNHARLAHHACFATESGVKFEKMKDWRKQQSKTYVQYEQKGMNKSGACTSDRGGLYRVPTE